MGNGKGPNHFLGLGLWVQLGPTPEPKARRCVVDFVWQPLSKWVLDWKGGVAMSWGGMILQCCLLSSIDCSAAFDRHFLEVQLWVQWELPSSFQSRMDGCGQEFSDEQLGHVRGCLAHVMNTHASLGCVGETVNHGLMCVIAVISQLFLRTWWSTNKFQMVKMNHLQNRNLIDPRGWSVQHRERRRMGGDVVCALWPQAERWWS